MMDGAVGAAALVFAAALDLVIDLVGDIVPAILPRGVKGALQSAGIDKVLRYLSLALVEGLTGHLLCLRFFNSERCIWEKITAKS
ncbi:hypothetical protein [uncultured Sneathiella sp.]|uniref:hypothetical protein n=1 Tax=uncultured Sneathiella sp. TaxID=879315 RepID=UPI0025948089|nr:hypothetical protein [uncultured Sneathiella sp.]